MSVTAETLRALMNLGIDGDKLISVVTVIERDPSFRKSRDDRDAKAKAAERSKRYRAKKKRDGGVTTITETSRHAKIVPSSSTLSFFTDSQKHSEEEVRKEGASSDFPPDYREQFWMVYPHKVDKANALKALERIRKKRAVPWSVMMEALARYAAKTDDRPWCNPTTWLRGARWTDEPAPPVPRNGHAPKQSYASIVRELDEEPHGQSSDDIEPKFDLDLAANRA